MSNNALANLSEEEAKKEHDDIQAEIAKEKGIKPEVPEETPESPKEDDKPDETPETPEDHPKDDKEDPEKPEVEEDIEPPKPRGNRHIPLAKFQDLKRELRETTEAKDKEINQLRKDLEDAKTNKELGAVISEFATKHNVTEDFAKDVLNMAKNAMPKPDASKEVVLGKAEAYIKKQEAVEAFEDEFADLLKDSPEASELKNQIRAKAYEDGNLEKSLFEIYHRHVKPAQSVRKKTGEVNRGPTSVRHSKAGFDPKTIADRIAKNEKGVFDGLKPEEIDQVFDYMEKNGSRYS